MSDETPQKPDIKGEKDKGKIAIHIVFPTEDALIIKVKPTTPFGKIYDNVALNKGIDVSAFSLAYDGLRIGREQTPKMLEMEDGDQIDGQLAQIGGGRSNTRP